MTSFEHDMGEMVKQSGVTEAKKTLAMSYVRATGKIANGSRGNVEALCDAMLAQTPIILEMYLERHAVATDIDTAILEHMERCKGNMARRPEGCDALPVASWQRLVFSVASKVTWPGAWMITALMFRDEISALINSLAKIQ